MNNVTPLYRTGRKFYDQEDDTVLLPILDPTPTDPSPFPAILSHQPMRQESRRPTHVVITPRGDLHQTAPRWAVISATAWVSFLLGAVFTQWIGLHQELFSWLG